MLLPNTTAILQVRFGKVHMMGKYANTILRTMQPTGLPVQILINIPEEALINTQV